MIEQIWRTSAAYAVLRWLKEHKRAVKIFIWTFIAVMFLGSAAAVAADGQTTPTGLGGLITVPDIVHGNSKTLFESYPLFAWQIDSDLGGFDFLQNVMNGVNQVLNFLLLTLVYMCLALVYWIFSLGKIDALSTSTAGLIGQASGTLMMSLFPAALAIGAAVAYALRQRDGTHNYNQILWLVASGVAAISLTTSPGAWVSGIDNARTIGSEAVVSMSTSAVNPDYGNPIPGPQTPSFNGTPTDNMLRKTADLSFRTLYVTPWCIADFGSIEACKRYAPDMLAMGQDTQARTQYIKDIIYNGKNFENKPNEGSQDAPTSQWVKGNTWWERMGILVLAILIAIVFCALMLVLGFSSLAALAMAYLLLVAGVFFAVLWVIPGRLRQWGIRWFDLLLGTVMTSIMATLTFTVVMLTMGALFSVSQSAGWAGTAVLALIVIFAGFKLRRGLEEIVGAFQPSLMRSLAYGAIGARMAGGMLRTVGRGARGLGRGLSRGARGTGRVVREYGRALNTHGYQPGDGIPRRNQPQNNYRPQVPQNPHPASSYPGPGRPAPRSRGGRSGSRYSYNVVPRPNLPDGPRRPRPYNNSSPQPTTPSYRPPAASPSRPRNPNYRPAAPQPAPANNAAGQPAPQPQRRPRAERRKEQNR